MSGGGCILGGEAAYLASCTTWAAPLYISGTLAGVVAGSQAAYPRSCENACKDGSNYAIRVATMAAADLFAVLNGSGGSLPFFTGATTLEQVLAIGSYLAALAMRASPGGQPYVQISVNGTGDAYIVVDCAYEASYKCFVL